MDSSSAHHSFTTLAPRLRAYLRTLVGQDADDLLQDLYLKFLKALPAVEDDHTREGWLFLNARGLALNHRRGEGRRRKRELAVAEEMKAMEAR